MTRIVRMVAIVLLALGMAGIGSAHPTSAAGGNILDCSFTTLQTDLQAGGDWFYNAGQCPSAIAVGGTITISSHASLTANGADVTLDGFNRPLFQVNSGVPFGLTGITLQNANAGLSQGGAIHNAGGTVTITNSTLQNNLAANGGAIDNEDGTVTITSSAFSNNKACGNNGAAITSFGTLTITSSVFSNNVTGSGPNEPWCAAFPSAGQAIGGAIQAAGPTIGSGVTTISNSIFDKNTADGTVAAGGSTDFAFGQGGAISYGGCNSGNSGCKLTVTGSTFTGNSALGDAGSINVSAGGAIAIGDAVVTIANSTFSGNSTTGIGGAIFNGRISTGGTITMTNSTIAGNTASAGGGGALNNGGQTESIGGTIIANNTGGNCTGNANTDLGYNLESGTDCGFTGTGSLQKTDPKLDGLANNGGPTRTMALQSTSPAIDQIPTSYDIPNTTTPLCPTTDQRGVSRPDASESTCDIGAYEFRDPVAVVGPNQTVVEGSTVTLDGSQSSGDAGPLTFSWTQTIGPPVTLSGATTAHPTFSAPSVPDGTTQALTFQLVVTDANGAVSAPATVVVTVTDGTESPPSISITSPTNDQLIQVGSPGGPATVTLTAPFTINDTPSSEPQTCSVQWDTGQPTSTFAPTNGSCTVTNSNLMPGVYQITVSVMETNESNEVGGTSSATTEIVVYDPSSGFVTGGGWINSPAGAMPANPSLTGKANFGFVSKYQKGASVPTGETEFQFQVGNLDFHSNTYSVLVIAGNQAQYRGTGTINGIGSYKFILTARDGDMTGGTNPDGFRMKITDSSGTAIYDNLLGGPDDLGNTQSIAGGNIIIHR